MGIGLLNEDECPGAWLAADDHCFMTVMLAIISSGSSFDTFTMSAGQGAGIPICRYGLEIQKGAICKAALSHFQALDLKLCASTKDDQPESQSALEFLAMLAKLKVRSLRVGSLEWQYGKANEAIVPLSGMDFPAMESLIFEEIDFHWEPFVALLKRQKSLRKLEVVGGSTFFPRRLRETVMRGLSHVTDISEVVEFNVLGYEAPGSEWQ